MQCMVGGERGGAGVTNPEVTDVAAKTGTSGFTLEGCGVVLWWWCVGGGRREPGFRAEKELTSGRRPELSGSLGSESRRSGDPGEKS